jgi:serine/threonine-protein kinase
VTCGLDCASPESIMDPTNLTPTGDQYSLGCTLYYLLTGQFPFPDGSAAEKMMAHQFKQPRSVQELNPDAPAELVAVVERLMQKAPDARFASAAEAAEALRPLAQSGGAPRARSIKEVTAPKPKAKAPDGLRSGVQPPPSAPESVPQATPAAARGGSSVAPSTPTPKPAGIGALPTRSSLRGSTPPAPMTPAKPLKQEPEPEEAPAERQIPGQVDDEAPPSFGERLGPIGITLAGIAACGVVYALARLLKLL